MTSLGIPRRAIGGEHRTPIRCRPQPDERRSPCGKIPPFALKFHCAGHQPADRGVGCGNERRWHFDSRAAFVEPRRGVNRDDKITFDPLGASDRNSGAKPTIVEPTPIYQYRRKVRWQRTRRASASTEWSILAVRPERNLLPSSNFHRRHRARRLEFEQSARRHDPLDQAVDRRRALA